MIGDDAVVRITFVFFDMSVDETCSDFLRGRCLTGHDDDSRCAPEDVA